MSNLESIQIYRVENNCGRGMYQGSDIIRDYVNKEKHPSPWDDSSTSRWWDTNYDNKHNLHFGFTSIAQLKMWLHQADRRQLLEDEGFTINVYTLTNNEATKNDYILGDTQAIFNKKFFTHTETLKLTEV